MGCIRRREDERKVVRFRMAGHTRAEKKQGGVLQTVLNIFGIILCALFIPVIILNMVMIVRSYTDPDHIPSVFGFSPVIVLSGSMYPEFDTGDMIFIQAIDPDTLQVGDVICFLEEETAVTHRIMEIQQEDGQTLYITQGDANNTEDALPVSQNQVQGKYTGHYIAGAGNFAMFLQSPTGMIVCIGGPVLLFLLWELLRRVVSGRQDDKEKRRLQAESSSREQEMAAMEEELRRLRAQVTPGGDGTGPAPNPEDFGSVSEVRYRSPAERQDAPPAEQDDRRL